MVKTVRDIASATYLTLEIRMEEALDSDQLYKIIIG